MNFYDSVIEGAQELPVPERGQLYVAALEYLYYGREPDFPMKPPARAIYVALHPVFENQRAQSERARKPRPSRRKPQGEPKASQTVAESQPNASRNLAESQPDTNRSLTDGEPKASQTVAESQPNANEQEQEQEREEEHPSGCSKKSRRRLFTPPDEAEVAAYAEERGIDGFDAQGFCDYYAAQGWKLSNGNPMRDWRAAVRRWDRNRTPKGQEGGGGNDRYGQYD